MPSRRRPSRSKSLVSRSVTPTHLVENSACGTSRVTCEKENEWKWNQGEKVVVGAACLELLKNIFYTLQSIMW